MKLLHNLRYIIAHVVDWVHVYIFRHRPYFTCFWVIHLWPDEEHSCWFCKSYNGDCEDEED